MRIVDLTLMEEQEIVVSRIGLLSGIRPSGRTINNSAQGRKLHGLLYIWSGEVSFSPEGEDKVSVYSGDLAIIPKGKRYSMRYVAEETTFVLINFDLKSENGKDVGLSEKIRVLAQDSEDRRIAGVMAKLEMCGGSRNLSVSFRRKELVYRLLSMIYRDSASVDKESFKYSGIIPGVLLLQQTYLENLPISTFANESGISVSSFRALFTKQYGLSPIQYRNKLRIERAREILIGGGCTVTEAAYLSGFDNLGYFCRYYKKIVGETPSETQSKNS